MAIAGLLNIILVLAVMGVVVYLIITFVPMPQPFKTAIIAIVAIILAIWVLNILLGHGGLAHIGACP